MECQSVNPSWLGQGSERLRQTIRSGLKFCGGGGERSRDVSAEKSPGGDSCGPASSTATRNTTHVRTTRIALAQTLAVLFMGLVPLPAEWVRVRALLDSSRSPRMNRADRVAAAGGYYEGLIGVDGMGKTSAGLAERRMGRPADRVAFNASETVQRLGRDFLMFELRPNLEQARAGHVFATNALGMRGRPCTLAKPEGTFRIALLGSSIDMGWGVGAEETYMSRLEAWLNAHAAERGPARRFEVLNFAVAAYSPLQRLEVFRRKAAAFEPDLVLYSATTLDTRLMEIHVCDMFQARVDLRYDFLRGAVADSGITGADLRLDAAGRLHSKDMIKAKLRPAYWSIYDATLSALAADCRSRGVPLACLIIPRVGKADAPDARGETVERLRELLARHANAVFDLSDTFDAIDPAELEISASDDHPNARGHERLFQVLAHALADEERYASLFPTNGASGSDGGRIVANGSGDRAP
jgi:hypothetical protein